MSLPRFYPLDHGLAASLCGLLRSAGALPLALAVVLVLSAPLGCGGSENPGPTTPEPTLSVTIAAPQDGSTVRGTVSLVASVAGASRPDPSSSLAPSVRFFVDDALVGSSSGPSYELSWDSSTVSNGAHTVRAQVDEGSRSASDVISIVGDNPGGGVSVAILPAAVTLAEEEAAQFSATLTGGGSGSVTWSVDGGPGNGAISTAGLYTAPTAFPTNATATVRATWTEDAGISGTATVTFSRGEQEVQVGVEPATAMVAVGQTQAFTATVTGSTNTGVTWAVIGGAANGTISAQGVYTAPSSVPNPPTVTVRATSLANGTKSGEAGVTINEASPLPPEQIELLGSTFRAGWTIQDSIREANELLAQAVFLANELFGTLTQVGNTEEFQYSNQPNDRLRVVFTNGETVEIVITDFQGDTSGNWEDFLRSHAIAYRFTSSAFDVQITSSRMSADSFQRDVNQTVAGAVTLEGVTWNVQGQVQGTEIFIFSESSTNTHDTYTIQGIFTAGTKRLEIAHASDFKDDFFSNSGNSFTNKSDTIGSGGTDGTTTVVFRNVVYSWSDTEQRDPIYEAEGRIDRDNADLGSLVTDPASGQVGIELTAGEIVAF